MKRRHCIAVGIALGVFGLVSGCAEQKATEAPGAPASPGPAGSGVRKTITYAIVPKMLNNPVFPLAEAGAKKAASDLQAQTGNTYKIIYQAPATGAASEQAAILEQLTAQKVDGISIAVVDANAVREPIDNAVAAGIPVICFDSDCADSRRSAFYAVDDVASGNEIARQFIAACRGDLKGEVAILSGQSSAPNLKNRVRGVEEVLRREAPGIKILPILYCEDSSDRAVELIQTTMRAKPDLRGLLFVGGWPLFVDNALESVKNFKRTVVVSMDTLPKQIEYLKSGQVYCLVGQKYYGWGEQSVNILEQIRTGKKTRFDSLIASGYDLVFNDPTPEQRALARDTVAVYSADEYARQWTAWTAKGSNE